MAVRRFDTVNSDRQTPDGGPLTAGECAPLLGILVKIIPSKRKILDSLNILAATHLPKLIEAAKGLVEHPFMEFEIENEDKFILKDITRRKSFQISACMDSASLYFCHL